MGEETPAKRNWLRITSAIVAVAVKRQEPFIFLALFALSFLVFWQFGIDRQPINHDKSLQIYIAQEIVRGNPPYLAVIFPKTPLTAILGALAIAVGDRLRLMDFISVRILFLVLGSLGVAFTFLVAETVSSDIWARLAAALTLLGFSLWGWSSAAGPEPKILMILWGIITLWALQERRWFLAGLAASLSFLSWQPAAIYSALALVTPLWKAKKERQKAFLQALAGVLIPIALVGIYLATQDALLPALRQTVWGQFAYLPPAEGWSLEKQITKLLRKAENGLGGEWWFVLLGAFGWLVLTARTLFFWFRPDNSPQSHPWPLLLSGYGWLLFSLRDFSNLPDLIPLLPHLALGLGGLLQAALSLLKRWTRLTALIQLGVIFGILAYGLQDLPLERDPYAVTLQDQIRNAALLDAFLGPQGQVQALGDFTLLVLSERTNLTRLIHLGPKHYNLLRNEPGGTEEVFNNIVAAKPKVLIIDRRTTNRIRNRDSARPLLRLAKEQYQRYLTSPHPWDSKVFARFVVKEINPQEVDSTVAFTFGNYFRLIGYRTAYSTIAGPSLAVTFYWQSLKETDKEYTVFLHIIDSQGTMLTQGDSPPVAGYYPTRLWLPGDIIQDTHLIPLPEGLPSGEYRLRVGMYLLETLERLPVTDEDGYRMANDEIIISGLRVE